MVRCGGRQVAGGGIQYRLGQVMRSRCVVRFCVYSHFSLPAEMPHKRDINLLDVNVF